MPSQHKHPPISFRPPEADRARLLQHVAETGKPVNAVLAKALTEYLDRHSEGMTYAVEMDARRQMPKLRQEVAPASSSASAVTDRTLASP